MVSGVERLFPHPLDADGALATLVGALGVADLRRILAAQGHPRSVDPRPALEATLLANLSDPDWVRRHVTSAEPEICEPILALAKGGSAPPDPSDSSDPGEYVDARYEDIPYGAGYLGTHWDRPATRREAFGHHPMAVEWAREHGIVFTSRGYGYTASLVQMPAEVALALRGSGYRAPFTPLSPEAVVGTVDAAAVEGSAGFAAAEFAQQAGAVLDTLARCPWPLVKSGGVALRELDRLAAAAVVTPSAARLALELADHAGLLMRTAGRLQTSPTFGNWRGKEAAERYAVLVAAWWDLPFAPSAASTPSRKTVRPLERPALCDPCDASRHSLIQAMAALPVGCATELGPLEATLRWRQPRSEPPVAAAGSGWALAWAEAEALGVAGSWGTVRARTQPALLHSWRRSWCR